MGRDLPVFAIILTLATQVPYTTSSKPDSTSSCQSPDRIRKLVADSVQWSPVRRTWTVFVTPTTDLCDSSSHGQDLGLTGINTSSSSLIIQEGDVVRISLDSGDDNTNDTANTKVLLYIASEEHFTASNCNASTVVGQALGDVTLAKDITLNQQQFSKGIALILGKCYNTLNQICLKLNITMKWNKCLKQGNLNACTGMGVCISNFSESSYGCKCCDGYTGALCEEKDACYENPCKNGGFCIDIIEGHDGDTFQCLCPYGYSGRTCEHITYKCDSQPCKNNGSCMGNQTSFTCICAPGFTGRLCEMNVDECLSNPCVHGICVDGEDGYQCFCAPGYGGRNCEFEYKECDSSPCINGGQCLEHVSTYTCKCGPGYTGNRCHIKVDLCDVSPCPVGTQCVDRGNNVSCECIPDSTGLNCRNKGESHNTCSHKVCQNGGTCWNSANSNMFCTCSPGFTGDKCQDSILPMIIPTLPDQETDLEFSPGVQMNHLHNIYIAFGTLSCAFLIVVVIVTFCHCRVHKTYKKFACRCLHHSLCSRMNNCRRHCSNGDQRNDKEDFSSEGDHQKKVQPNLDSLFESCSGLDFTDSIEAPLINLALK